MPANPIHEEANGEVPEERRASSIVPPVAEDLCITPLERIVSTPTLQQHIKANNVPPDKSSDQTNTLNNDNLVAGSSSESGIILNIDSSEIADFVYPRVYTSSVNVVIK